MENLKEKISVTASWIIHFSNGPQKDFVRIFDSKYEGKLLLNNDSLSEKVEEVLLKRRNLVKELSVPLLGFEEVIEKGELIISYPISSVSDGASEFVSNSMFDIYEVPLWDYWVCACSKLNKENSDKGIVAWVPNDKTGLVQKGINCAPLNNIEWCDLNSLEIQ